MIPDAGLQPSAPTARSTASRISPDWTSAFMALWSLNRGRSMSRCATCFRIVSRAACEPCDGERAEIERLGGGHELDAEHP